MSLKKHLRGIYTEGVWSQHRDPQISVLKQRAGTTDGSRRKEKKPHSHRARGAEARLRLKTRRLSWNEEDWQEKGVSKYVSVSEQSKLIALMSSHSLV